jgi:hypothetical protein
VWRWLCTYASCSVRNPGLRKLTAKSGSDIDRVCDDGFEIMHA